MTRKTYIAENMACQIIMDCNNTWIRITVAITSDGNAFSVLRLL